MTPAETATFLRQFNEWRRGDDDIEQPDPREIGEAIDAAVEMIERLEQARLNGAGSEREAALMAKLEAAEKTKSDWLRANAPGGWIDDLRVERDALQAKIEAMEKQEPFDADSDVFRIAFEAALNAGNWPATRQGDGYRSPSTQIAWRIAFSTVNRMKLYLAPGAQPAPSVPEGWKLVPIEPTQRMRDAWSLHIFNPFRTAYQAMLAAAPEAKP